LCRREGIKLMLKGIRCDSAKCAMEKQWRQQPPGMHGWKRTRGTEYAVRLREKQKVKRYYGLMDAQFMRFFRMAAKFPGNTGLILMQFLERRLDNVVYKLGLALSRRNARQMVAHGLVHVNGKKVDRPSYLVNQGDKISVKPTERTRNFVKSIVAATEGQTLQGWLQLDRANLEGTVLALPTREDVQIPVEENLIVEFCSR
jgi:small subunit ribosomal protein S4